MKESTSTVPVTYRHDAARSGSTKIAISPEMKKNWSANIGDPSSPDGYTAASKLSAITVAEGKVFVALQNGTVVSYGQ